MTSSLFSSTPRAGGRWIAFDSTKGYPGEGPGRADALNVLRREYGTGARQHGRDLQRRGTPTTRNRYQKLYDECAVFLATRNLGELPVLAESWTTRQIAECLVAFAQHLFDEDRPISDARFAVAAVQWKHSHLRGNLKLPWTSVREWQLLEPGLPRIPLPGSVVRAAVSLACVWGWWRTATALLLNWETWARPIEMATVRLSSLVVPEDLGGFLGAPRGVMAIWKSKTSRAGFLIQHVVIRNEKLPAALANLKAISTSSARLLPYSQNVYQSRLAALLKALGVSPKLFTLGSIRAGGATEDWLQHENVGRTQMRGRWKHPLAMQHYLQESTACLATIQLSRRTLNLVDALEPLVDELFPPTRALLRRSTN